MSALVVGLSHHTAPVTVLERAALSADAVEKLLADVHSAEHICEAVAVVLREDHHVQVGREAVRVALRDAGLVWRRPRPLVRRRDPDRAPSRRGPSRGPCVPPCPCSLWHW